MQAIAIIQPGGPEVLQFTERETPVPGEGQVLVKVKATALNRADTLQRRGLYPPPPGVTDIPGLEMSGEVVEMGPGASGVDQGQRVCGLLAGGGYAEYVVIHEDLLLPLPGSMSYDEGAAIPEVFLTAFQAMVWLGRLQAEERVLIHAGASGVGTAAIQLARIMKAEAVVTASRGKHDLCLSLGARRAIDYRSESFAEVLSEAFDPAGVDLIIDVIGAPYAQGNMKSLRQDGRWVVLAFMGGAEVEQFDFAQLLRKRVHLMGSTLRARPLEYKVELCRDFRNRFWNEFAAGNLKPVIDRVMSWKDVTEAHELMERNINQGKIVLRVD